MAIFNGRDLLISIGQHAFAYVKSCEIETSCDTIEVTSTNQGTWKNYIIGRKSWKVRCSYLVVDTEMNSRLLTTGTNVTLYINIRSVGTQRLTGSAVCTSCHITGTTGSLTNGSFEFIGNGPLSTGS